MTRESYIKLTAYIRGDEKKIRLVSFANRILTGSAYLLYPLFLFSLLMQKHPFLLRAFFVPAVSFVSLSVFRDRVNAPRPYEKFGIPPVLNKDTKGHSFPSRHVFCIFLIAITIFYIYPTIGVILFLAGIGLAIIRVIGGVHEPRDVIVGALAGIACGIIGYYLL